jgi:hypothetical protein
MQVSRSEIGAIRTYNVPYYGNTVGHILYWPDYTGYIIIRVFIWIMYGPTLVRPTAVWSHLDRWVASLTNVKASSGAYKNSLPPAGTDAKSHADKEIPKTGGCTATLPQAKPPCRQHPGIVSTKKGNEEVRRIVGLLAVEGMEERRERERTNEGKRKGNTHPHTACTHGVHEQVINVVGDSGEYARAAARADGADGAGRPHFRGGADELKQALKESKREANGWPTVERNKEEARARGLCF